MDSVSQLFPASLNEAFRRVVDAGSRRQPSPYSDRPSLVRGVRSLEMPRVEYPTTAFREVARMLRDKETRSEAVFQLKEMSLFAPAPIELVQTSSVDPDTWIVKGEVDDLGMPWHRPFPPSSQIFRCPLTANRFISLDVQKSAVSSQEEIPHFDEATPGNDRDPRANRKVPRHPLCSYEPLPESLERLVPCEQVAHTILPADNAFVLLGNRAVNEYWVATLTRRQFYTLPESMVPFSFPWIHAHRQPGEFDHLLWQNEMPLFSPDVTDDDVLLCQIELNRELMKQVLQSADPFSSPFPVKKCSITRRGVHCVRDVSCECDKCLFHCRCGSSRRSDDDEDDFNWRDWLEHPRSPWRWSFAWTWRQNRTPRTGRPRRPDSLPVQQAHPTAFCRRSPPSRLTGRLPVLHHPDSSDSFPASYPSWSSGDLDFEVAVREAQGLFSDVKLSWDATKQVDVNHIIKLPIFDAIFAALSARNSAPDYKTVIREAMFLVSHLVSGGVGFANLATSVSHFLSSSGLSHEIVLDIAQWWENRTNAQGPAELVAGGLTVICIALVALCVGKIPPGKSIDSLFNRFSRVGQIIRSADVISEKITPFIEEFIDFFRLHLFGYSKRDLSGWKSVEEYCKEVQALENSELENRIASDVTLGPLVDTLLQRGYDLNRQLDALKVPPSARSNITWCVMFLRRTVERIGQHSLSSRKARTSPVVVHFYGDSGVGKTTSLNLLCPELLWELGCRDPSDRTTKVYNRSPGAEFWDGYLPGTKIVIYDDFGTVRDSISTPSGEAIETIRGANTAPWVLNMADLSSKGSTLFEAPVVIWTSNRSHYKFESMTNQEALINRVTLKFKQYVKPEYSLTRTIQGQQISCLDRTKLKDHSSLSTEFMAFDLVDPTDENERVLQAGLTYEQMADMVRSTVRINVEFGRKYNDAADDYFAKLVEGNGVRPTPSPGAPVPEPARPAQMNNDEGFEEPEAAPFVCNQFHLQPEEPLPLVAERCVPTFYDEPSFARRILHHMSFGFYANDTLHLNLAQTLPSYSQSELPGLTPGGVRRRDLEAYFAAPCVKVSYRNAPFVSYVFRNAYNHASRSVMPYTIFGTWIALIEDLIEPCDCPGHTMNRDEFLVRVRFAQRKINAKSVGSFFSTCFEKAVATLAVGALAAPILLLLKWLFSSVSSFLTPHAVSLEPEAASYNHGALAVPRKKFEGAIPRINEGTTDQNAREVLAKVAKNQYLIWYSVGEGRWSPAGTATFVTGRVLMMNQHIWSALPDEFKLCNNRGIDLDIRKDDCQTSGVDSGAHVTKDVILLECPRHVPVHSSLLSLFMTKYDFSLHSNLPRAALIGYNVEGTLTTQFTDCVRTNDSVFQIKTSTDVVNVREAYEYGIETIKGDCGSLLVAFEKNLARKICAIHAAAGNPGSVFTGTGSAIHQEHLKQLLGSIDFRFTESVTDGDIQIPHEEPLVIREGQGPISVEFSSRLPIGLQPVGKVAPVHSATKTKLRQSPVFGITCESKLAPALLKPNDQFDPLEIAMKKLVVEKSHQINQTYLEWATEDVKQMYSVNRRVADQRVLTFEEGIAGIEGDPYYPPINRSTSPGYGWPKNGKGKTAWLGEEEYVFDNPEVTKKVQQMLDNVRNNKRTGCVWTDTLKDELRPESKISQGKTRLFSAGEMASTILLRMYFDGFCAHLMRNRIDNESAIGINVYGPEWGRLRARLQEVGPHVFAGDFTNYDGSLPADLLWKVQEVAEHHYKGQSTPEDSRIRANAWLDIVNSVHVCQGDVYRCQQSNPSGCPFTTPLNTAAHSIAKRYVFLEAAAKYAPAYCNMQSYRKFVRLISYGDDDVVNVHPEIVEWFNQDTMTEMYRKLGMTYTDETKSGSATSRAIHEVAFLKRKFRYDPKSSRTFAPLALDTILEIPNWIKGSDVWFLTAQCIETAVYELAQHDRQTFDRCLPLFELAASKVREFSPVVLLPYSQYHMMDMVRHYGTPALAVPKALISSLRPATPLVAQMYEPEQYSAPSQPSVPSTSSAAQPVDGEVTKVETTTFYEDANVMEAARPVSAIPDTDFLVAAQDQLANSVIGFLSRRILLSEAVWASNSAPGTVLLQHALPGDWIKTPMILEKVQGFRYLRCDLVFELQVNAQAFNAGALIMWYEPLSMQLSYSPSSIASLTGITGYPNVFYYVEDGTAAKLTVRFNNVLSHFDLVNRFGTMGRLRVQVASALTGAADADISLWAWAENVDIQMPTGLPLAAQGMPDVSVKSPSKHMVAQQAEKKTTGTVEKVAGALKNVSAGLSKVPVVGQFAAAAEPVFDIAGKVASFFGWSKPRDDALPQLVTQTQTRHMANYNGDSKAKVLSVDAENATDIPTSVFGTDNDEMSILEIVRRPIFLTTFTIDSSMTQNTLLWGWPVNPNACITVTTPGPSPPAGTMYINTYLSYLAQLFRFWRGKIVYTMKFVKTPYHSGRIRIFWVPGATPQTTFSSIDLNKVYSEVHDIRVKNEVEFGVPFTWNAPWQSVFAETGMVYVTLINSLRMPSTAAPTIETLVFINGGDDFQFAYPDAFANMALVLDKAQVPTVPRISSVREAQGNIYESSDTKEFAPNSTGIGEAVLSLRQVIRRYYPFSQAPAGNGWRQTSYRDVVYTAAPNFVDDALSTDIMSLVGVLYRFKAGPMRFLKSYHTVPFGTAITYSLQPGVDFNTGAPSRDILAPVVVNWVTNEPSAELETPFYQQWPAIPTDIGAPQPNNGIGAQVGYFISIPANQGTEIFCADSAGEPANTATYRQAGESFSFGFLIGPPVTFEPAAEKGRRVVDDSKSNKDITEVEAKKPPKPIKKLDGENKGADTKTTLD
jgi:hypothetical protein